MTLAEHRAAREVEELLTGVYEAFSCGEMMLPLHRLTLALDTWLTEGSHAHVECLLTAAEPHRLGLQGTLAILTDTRSAQDDLEPFRTSFVEKACEYVRYSHPEKADRLTRRWRAGRGRRAFLAIFGVPATFESVRDWWQTAGSPDGKTVLILRSAAGKGWRATAYVSTGAPLPVDAPCVVSTGWLPSEASAIADLIRQGRP